MISNNSNGISKMGEITVIGRGSSFDLNNIREINGPIFLLSFWHTLKIDNNGKIFYNHYEDQNGKAKPFNEDLATSSFTELFGKRISLIEKFYKPPLIEPYPYFAPSGSLLPIVCALSYFAEKINVYGWDFYLDSSPEKMNYWQLFFNMYKYKHDFRSQNHFESAVLNFYYGYQLSKLPNIKIHGYMGQLNNHEKLIRRIEKVLFL